MKTTSETGKTTLIKLLMKKVRGLSYSVSATTRPPSKKEKNGRDYFFISEEEFKKESGKYSILHLAMHTLVNNEEPNYSKLVFKCL